jgi:class 3 adenylate cyclase
VEFCNYVLVRGTLAAAGCMYVIRRVTRLVADVSEEHGRRERLARYFSPEVAMMLAASPGDGAVGESREVSLLFSDLRDFTALAELLDGQQVVALLNDYHEAMVDTIFAFGGTLDKYLGDELMAYFGPRWRSRTTQSARFAARSPCRSGSRV